MIDYLVVVDSILLDAYVVVDGYDMVWLSVGYIEWNLVDNGCDFHGDTLETELWLCRLLKRMPCLVMML